MPTRKYASVGDIPKFVYAERDVIIKRIIPSLNRKLADKLIRIVPVDLRWGVLSSESKDCHAIQKTCLNQIDKCRDQTVTTTSWFQKLLIIFNIFMMNF